MDIVSGTCTFKTISLRHLKIQPGTALTVVLLREEAQGRDLGVRAAAQEEH